MHWPKPAQPELEGVRALVPHTPIALGRAFARARAQMYTDARNSGFARIGADWRRWFEEIGRSPARTGVMHG